MTLGSKLPQKPNPDTDPNSEHIGYLILKLPIYGVLQVRGAVLEWQKNLKDRNTNQDN